MAVTPRGNNSVDGSYGIGQVVHVLASSRPLGTLSRLAKSKEDVYSLPLLLRLPMLSYVLQWFFSWIRRGKQTAIWFQCQKISLQQTCADTPPDDLGLGRGHGPKVDWSHPGPDTKELSSLSLRHVQTYELFQRLPNELWLKVFSFFSSDDLLAVTRVCWSFHSLSRPLLFSSLVIKLSDEMSSSEAEQLSDRIAFFSSEKISLYVKRVTIRRTSPLAVLSWPSPITLGGIFSVLRCFTRLQELICQFLHIPSEGIQSLQHFRLKSLRIWWCHFEPTIHKVFASNVFIFGDLCSWWEITDLEQIEHLQLGTSRDVILPPKLPLMSSLVTLTISSAATTNPLFVDFLRQCPHLRRLVIFCSQEPTGVTPVPNLPFLPELTYYRGPDSHALLCSQGKRLQFLSMWSWLLADPVSICTTLRDVGGLNRESVTSLEFSVLSITDELFQVVATSFLNLVNLKIRAPSVRIDGIHTRGVNLMSFLQVGWC
jgi:hypothetical protein